MQRVQKQAGVTGSGVLSGVFTMCVAAAAAAGAGALPLVEPVGSPHHGIP
jgi:hypothetical protein